MSVPELLDACGADPEHFQLHINGFLDDLRRVPVENLAASLLPGPATEGQMAGLIAAIASAVCRERGVEPPEWVGRTGSPTPFFVFPARSFALRLRLMIESPAPFKIRNVFVPENYLSRA
jgi:hypothetical protein